MNDERWMTALRAMDRPVDPDPTFADQLFGSLTDGLGQRRSRPPLLLVAAVLALTAALAGALAVGSGLIELPIVRDDRTSPDAPDVRLAEDGEVGFGRAIPEYAESWCPDGASQTESDDSDYTRHEFECPAMDGGSASFAVRTPGEGVFLVRTDIMIPVYGESADDGRARALRWLASFESNYAAPASWLVARLDNLRSMADGMPTSQAFAMPNGAIVVVGVILAGTGPDAMATLWLTSEAEAHTAGGCWLRFAQLSERADIADMPQTLGAVLPSIDHETIVVPMNSRDELGRPLAHVEIIGVGWDEDTEVEIAPGRGPDDWPRFTGGGSASVTFDTADTYEVTVKSETAKCEATVRLDVVPDGESVTIEEPAWIQRADGYWTLPDGNRIELGIAAENHSNDEFAMLIYENDPMSPQSGSLVPPCETPLTSKSILTAPFVILMGEGGWDGEPRSLEEAVAAGFVPVLDSDAVAVRPGDAGYRIEIDAGGRVGDPMRTDDELPRSTAC